MVRKAKAATPHLRLRVEPSLLSRLEKSAEKNGRTLTGEIVDRLNASYKRDEQDAHVLEVVTLASEKLQSVLNSAAARGESLKALEDELFDMDLKALSERYPDVPVDEHAKWLRAANARRAALKAEMDKKL